MLNAIVEDRIWEVRHWLKMPGPGVYFNCRMTIIKLEDGSVLLHSPVPIDEETASAIEEIGPVSAIIAPSLLHHLFVPEVVTRYPDATRFAAPGLAEKRQDIDFHHTLGPELGPEQAPWLSELEPIFVEGAPSVNEFIFFHLPTRSLVVTDLLFNLQEFKGAMSPWIFRMSGTYKRFAQSKLWRFFIKDRAAYEQSFAPLKARDIQRLIMAHGEVIEGPDAHSKVMGALGV